MKFEENKFSQHLQYIETCHNQTYFLLISDKIAKMGGGVLAPIDVHAYMDIPVDIVKLTTERVLAIGNNLISRSRLFSKRAI